MKHKQGPGKDLFTVNGWENATVYIQSVAEQVAGCPHGVSTTAAVSAHGQHGPWELQQMLLTQIDTMLSPSLTGISWEFVRSIFLQTFNTTSYPVIQQSNSLYECKLDQQRMQTLDMVDANQAPISSPTYQTSSDTEDKNWTTMQNDDWKQKDSWWNYAAGVRQETNPCVTCQPQNNILIKTLQITSSRICQILLAWLSILASSLFHCHCLHVLIDK